MKNKQYAYLAVAILCVVLLVGILTVFSNTPKTLELKALYAAGLGGDYLVRGQHGNGSFTYEYDAETDEEIGGYNMLRHSGTIYALLELYQDTGEVVYLLSAHNAIKYLRTTIAPCPAEFARFSCAYDGEKTKLGGNALAMLALLKYGEVTSDDVYQNEALGLASWIKATQAESGEFTRHIQFRNGERDGHVSDYYPGEAIYALMNLYEATGDEQWLELSGKAAAWLISVRDAAKTSSTIDHDHWLLYGLRELYTHTHKKIYLDHAKKIVDGIVATQHRDGVDVEWIGGYYVPPRSTPTATRSEGLGAAYGLFKQAGETEYARKSYEALELGVQFQLKTFIDAPTARSFPSPTRSFGGFRYSLEEDTVRIDYVQHNISSLLLFYRIFNE